MKLLAVRMARSIWLLPQYFVNPNGVDLRPAVKLIAERYSFRVSPDDAKASGAEGLRFENGKFDTKKGAIAVLNLVLQAEGIVAETRSSTADTDAFLCDVLGFVCAEFKLPDPSGLPFQKKYISELNVSYSKQPQIFHPQMKSFLNALAPEVVDERSPGADFIGFQFGPDQSLTDKPPFRFEREIRTPFQHNRYYSFAPFRTDVHVKVLKSLGA